jgi:cytosine/adenosine deaminase-related metal-dependent hydrolase
MEAKQRADAAGVVLNLHQSYSPADTEADRQRFGGKDPLLHLADIGFLDRNITFGHANHLTDAECDILLQTGPSVAWAPAASMMWGHGGTIHGRHAELWRRGANIALGSDSANWSNDFDLWRQANLAVLSARDAHGDRTYLIAEDGMRMATRGGARASGLDRHIGSIEPGKRADIVIHTLNRPEIIPTTNMIRNLFYSSRSKSVHTVIVNGKVVLEEGVFVGIDEPEMLAHINEASMALLSRMGKTIEPNWIRRQARAK